VQLPEKRWFRIQEIAQRWSIPLNDLEDYALDEMLQLSVFVIDLPVEAGSWEHCNDDAFRIPEGRILLNGPQPLLRRNLAEIFRAGRAQVCAFRTANPETYVEVIERIGSLTVRREDLVITREERDRFERAHGFQQPLEAAWHNEDFTSVRAGGAWHALGPKQAAVIRILKEAAETQEPWRDGKRLLADAGSSLLRLVDLFKRKTAWRQLVMTDGKGRYRLNPELASPSSQRIRVFRRTGCAPKQPSKSPELMIPSSP